MFRQLNCFSLVLFTDLHLSIYLLHSWRISLCKLAFEVEADELTQR